MRKRKKKKKLAYGDFPYWLVNVDGEVNIAYCLNLGGTRRSDRIWHATDPPDQEDILSAVTLYW
jgi:hypothetical protein